MSETFRALVLYWSAGGNTKKVAEALHQTLSARGLAADIREITPDLDVNILEYDLVLLGAPVYAYLPPKPVVTFLEGLQQSHLKVSPASPERPGRFAVVFCTYSGPHTGIREAVPALKYMGQFLEHGGVRVVEEWAVVGEFHKPEQQALNLGGRLGDIRGRPNESDLADVCGKLVGLLRRLKHMPGLAEAEL
jgi:flavorubredoxin